MFTGCRENSLMIETLSNKKSNVPSSIYTIENNFEKTSKLVGVDSPNLYLHTYIHTYIHHY